MSAPPAGKLPKDYDKLPVPQPQATSVRKRDPKLLAVIDPGKCFGRGCEFCIAVCPVPECITLTTNPDSPDLSVCTVNFDTCIGMLPFTTVTAKREAYSTNTFSAEMPPKK
jgi:ferredoxin